MLAKIALPFHHFQFVKRWQIFSELNSKRLYQSSGKEKESSCLVFTFSTKHEIRNFPATAKKCTKKRDVQSCCFANLNLLLFCRSHCRHRRRCISSLKNERILFSVYF